MDAQGFLARIKAAVKRLADRLRRLEPGSPRRLRRPNLVPPEHIPADPVEHAGDFALRYYELLEGYSRRGMRELGIPDTRIGAYDIDKHRRNYSRRYFGLEADYLLCYRDVEDNYGWKGLKPTKRLLLSGPTRDFESIAWKCLVRHLKRQQQEEEWHQTAQLLLKLQQSLWRGPVSPTTEQRVRLRIIPLLNHVDFQIRSNAEWVVHTLEEIGAPPGPA
jgi:hypothetical protein